jgi:hypothetical protein
VLFVQGSILPSTKALSFPPAPEPSSGFDSESQYEDAVRRLHCLQLPYLSNVRSSNAFWALLFLQSKQLPMMLSFLLFTAKEPNILEAAQLLLDHILDGADTNKRCDALMAIPRVCTRLVHLSQYAALYALTPHVP